MTPVDSAQVSLMYLLGYLLAPAHLKNVSKDTEYYLGDEKFFRLFYPFTTSLFSKMRQFLTLYGLKGAY